MGDFTRLEQVFVNILANARDALSGDNGGPKGGTLTVKSSVENNSIIITFQDDGPGIEKENLDRIFDPFFTTKEVGKGTGLGLSITHGIIKEHGGHIGAESDEKGTCFTITLPLAEESLDQIASN